MDLVEHGPKGSDPAAAKVAAPAVNGAQICKGERARRPGRSDGKYCQFATSIRAFDRQDKPQAVNLGAQADCCVGVLVLMSRTYCRLCFVHVCVQETGVLLCLIMAIAICALILWVMAYASYLDILLHHQLKMDGPVVKLLLLIDSTVTLILWLIFGISGSAFAGLLYGFPAQIMTVFSAVGEGKEKPFVQFFVIPSYSWGIVLLLVDSYWMH